MQLLLTAAHFAHNDCVGQHLNGLVKFLLLQTKVAKVSICQWPSLFAYSLVFFLLHHLLFSSTWTGSNTKQTRTSEFKYYSPSSSLPHFCSLLLSKSILAFNIMAATGTATAAASLKLNWTELSLKERRAGFRVRCHHEAEHLDIFLFSRFFLVFCVCVCSPFAWEDTTKHTHTNNFTIVLVYLRSKWYQHSVLGLQAHKYSRSIA